MANMAAQWSTHNRELWMELEAQVLFWGVRDDPIYVVTGPVWNRFPSDRFDAVEEGLVETGTIPEPGDLLAKLNGDSLSRDIPLPTGFYKVIFQPGENGEPDRAIGFLAPHTRSFLGHFVGLIDCAGDFPSVLRVDDDCAIHLLGGSGKPREE